MNLLSIVNCKAKSVEKKGQSSNKIQFRYVLWDKPGTLFTSRVCYYYPSLAFISGEWVTGATSTPLPGCFSPFVPSLFRTE